MKNLVLLMLFIGCAILNAQEYIQETPTANWPYLFKDFQNAKIKYKDGSETKSTVNYHLLNKELQFIREDIVFAAEKVSDIDRVVLSNGFVLVQANKLFYRLLGEGKILLVESYKGNKNDLFETEGAYGSSTNTSAIKKENSVYYGGIPGVNFKSLEKGKTEGKTFSVDIKKHFLKDDKIYPANKKKLLEMFAEDADRVESLLKKNKIKFKKEEDLIKLLKLL